MAKEPIFLVEVNPNYETQDGRSLSATPEARAVPLPNAMPAGRHGQEDDGGLIVAIKAEAHVKSYASESGAGRP